MFVGRKKELDIIKKAIESRSKAAILVYGRRRIGKTSLILEALKDCTGVKIVFTATPDEISGNMRNLSLVTSEALNEPWIEFSDPRKYFHYLSKRDENITLVIDEYQDFRGNNKAEAVLVDALIRDFIDYSKDNINVIISGSAVRVLENLIIDNSNPLFMRFSSIINLKELNYLEASNFYKNTPIMEKIAYYAVFGGLPNILSQIIPEKGIEGNIEDLILAEEGFARYYVESVIDKEISPINNGEIIIKRIGNGKKHYSQIESSISDEKKRKQLSKTLKELTEAHLIEKMNPINKPDDKKKTFYFISSNLIRFYMTYVIGAQITGSKKAYFEKYISPSLNTFISYRFEDIAKQYFSQLDREDVIAIGTYWYDDRIKKTNGEFDIALETLDGYEIYEAKYYGKPLPEVLMREEIEKATRLEGLSVSNFGMIASSGFEANELPIRQISGKEIYKEK